MQAENPDDNQQKPKRTLIDRPTFFALSFIFIPVGFILLFTPGAGAVGFGFLALSFVLFVLAVLPLNRF